MKTLVKCTLLFFLSFPAFADIQKCIEDYNEAVKERNNARGSHQTADNYLKRARSMAEKDNKKELFEKAIEWIDVAESNIKRAEKKLELVKLGGCPETLVENANGLTQKNITDIATFDKFRLDVKTFLSIMQ